MNNSKFSNLENINIDEFNVSQKNVLNYNFHKSLDELLDSNKITINNNINNNINTIKSNTILSIDKPSISFIYVVYSTDVKEGDILEQLHDDIFIKQKDVLDFIKKRNVVNCNKTTNDLYQATEDLFCDDFKVDFKTKLKISICESISYKC
jgi:hypothetical protein